MAARADDLTVPVGHDRAAAGAIAFPWAAFGHETEGKAAEQVECLSLAHNPMAAGRSSHSTDSPRGLRREVEVGAWQRMAPAFVDMWGESGGTVGDDMSMVARLGGRVAVDVCGGAEIGGAQRSQPPGLAVFGRCVFRPGEVLIVQCGERCEQRLLVGQHLLPIQPWEGIGSRPRHRLHLVRQTLLAIVGVAARSGGIGAGAGIVASPGYGDMPVGQNLEPAGLRRRHVPRGARSRSVAVASTLHSPRAWCFVPSPAGGLPWRRHC